MLDTRNPLRVCTAAERVETPDYWKSWSPR